MGRQVFRVVNEDFRSKLHSITNTFAIITPGMGNMYDNDDTR